MRKKVKKITNLETNALTEKKKQAYLQELEMNPLALKQACYLIQDDKEMVIKSLHKSLANIEYASKNRKSDPEIAMILAKSSGLYLLSVDEKFRDNDQIMLEGVKSSPLAIRIASERLQNSKKFILQASSEGSTCYKEANETIQKDKIFMAEAKAAYDTWLEENIKKLEKAPKNKQKTI